MRWWFRKRGAEAEAKTVDADALTIQRLLGVDMSVKSGVAVNVTTALQVATVLACARVIAEGVAQLPVKLYRETENGGKEPAKDDPLYRLLWRRPNDWMTSFELREALTMHAVLTGNGYAFVNRLRNQPRELLPLMPGNVTPRQLDDYTLVYDVRDRRGAIGTFRQGEILHIRGPNWNGVVGMDAVQLAREAIGLAIVTEESQSRLHSNGARPGGVLSVEGGMSDEVRARLKKEWEDNFGGGRNAFKTAVLDVPTKWTPFAMSGVDSQHLETRKHQIEEICRAMRVFPQMVGFADKTATYASAEQFFIAHVIHSLGPWIERWEQAIERDLIAPDADTFARFSVQGLLRGDNTSRSNFYKTMVLTGIMTRNEARSFEELNPLPGLDEPLVPLNMASQAEIDAIAKDAVDAAKAALIGHNGGPPLADEAAIDRVKSAITGRRWPQGETHGSSAV